MSELIWTRIAASAEAALAGAGQGARERNLTDVARHARISAPTLRTYLLAFRFIERLDASDKSKALSIPVAALEIIGRWHQYDPATALSRLRAYDLDRDSVRSIRREEKASRAGGRAAIAKRRESNYRDFVKKYIGGFATIWPPTPIDYPVCEAAGGIEPDDLSGKADFILCFAENEAPPEIAVLIVGPYTSSYLYRARAADWCLRALGLTYFYRRVALVLPRSAEAEKYAEFLEMARDARSRIELLRAVPREPSYRYLRARARTKSTRT